MTTTHLEQDNIALVRRGFDAFAAGDMAALGALFDENATWHSEGAGMLKSEYRGRDAIFAMFAQLHQETAGTFKSKPIAMAAAGDKVFVQTSVSGDRRGRSLHAGEVVVFSLAGSRVGEVRLYSDNHQASSAFWA
ncbi:MAG: nuclear transport factor 2 family protein [Vulcanimicrobiaceae bacterium]